MTAKQVIPRRLAIRDVDEIIAYYLETSTEAVALGFVDALESAYDRIGFDPAIGSPRYAYELALPGLRSWPLKRYPYWIFYLERDHHIDVWRVLHGSRDLPQWMHAQDESE
ncbi:type II toxin-antitoxin system RelE/ParE family toxin [Halochromatium glycolicum]|uniref:Plasmid stabilization protein n=1 Tax=Halochromatium glycolicum TaxID=85075 RepID=A0AAJ0U8A2_9GAMM|nr:type II toxin-antitoxin system RelE/ParE family toxin [Halochromatium glycolicum]MBK1707038.1 plasmid stabilization protein [Halochromatium glycolicum]